MLVLITGGASGLGQAIAARVIAEGHAVRLTDRAPLPCEITPPHPRSPRCWAWLTTARRVAGRRAAAGGEHVQCALDDDEETAALLAGVDQLVHVEPALPLPTSGGDNTWLDLATRCSYNLLRAAAAAGVARATVLGTMDVFMPYSVDHGVLPEWQPLPSAELDTLAPHMGEFVAREFAMCGAVRVLVARLGTLVAEAPAADAADAPRWWITAEEAAEAIVTELIVRFPLPPFSQSMA